MLFALILGKTEPTVAAFIAAERNLRKINERPPCVTVKFQQAYVALYQPNAAQPYWHHRSNFKNIRDNVRDHIEMPMSDKDALYYDCLQQYISFFYNLHLHETIVFYNRARGFASQRNVDNTNGGDPQVKN